MPTYCLEARRSAPPSTVSTLNGHNGFRFGTSGGAIGSAVVGGGFNGDGFDDVAFGPSIVFGASSFPAELSRTALNGTSGFLLSSVPRTSATGDFNGDGVADLLVGFLSGTAAVVYGTSHAWPANFDLAK